MATEIINTVSLTKNPEFKNVKTINKNFRKIKKEHCNSLLDFLYNDGLGKWQNPFTKKFLRRESPIIISFLSRCYYMDDDSKINIHGCNLTYKKHIEKFINKEYLYVPSKKKSTNSSISNVNTRSVHGGGLRRSSHRISPRSNQAHRHSNSTINAGPPHNFNSGGTWQPVFIQPFAQSFVQPHEQSFTQSFVQPFTQPLSQSSYAYQTPPLKTYQQPILANNADINRKLLQKEDPYFEDIYSGTKWHKRNIPNNIWEFIINKLGSAYWGADRGKLIEGLNKKYTDDEELFAIWKKEEATEPEKVKKEKDLYKKMEDDDRYKMVGYLIFNLDSNGKKILKARNGFFGHFFLKRARVVRL